MGNNKLRLPCNLALISLLVWLVLGIPSGFGQRPNSEEALSGSKKESYKPKYQTIAHQALDLESELEGVEPNYELLDSIIDEAKRRITTSPPYSKEEAINILQTINDILLEKNFLNKSDVGLLLEALQPLTLDNDTIEYLKRIEPERTRIWKHPEDMTSTLVPTLKQKVHALSHLDEAFHFADCDILTLLYLGVGDALKLPIQAVYAPQHAFIRWHFSDGDYLNWETTEANALTDEEYKLWRNIPSIALRTGAYLKSLSKDQAIATIYKNRGDAWKQKGDLDRAISDFDQAIAINQNHAEAYCDRAITYSLKKDYERGITDLNKAIAINPNFAFAYYNRGRAYYDKGDCDPAIADYNSAIALYPGFAAAYTNRGLAYRHKGDYDRAIADYNTAIAINPNGARSYDNRANAYGDKGEYESAIADYNKAISINPNYGEAYVNRGIAYCRQGNYNHGLADFEKAIAIDPNLAEAYCSRSDVYLEKGNFNSAITDSTKAIDINPKLADAYVIRGLARCQIGKYELGIADFDKAIAINPEYAEAYSGRGAAYCKEGYDDRAIADFNKAIAIKPNLGKAYKNRAIAWFCKQEYARAWTDVKRCRELGETPDPQFIRLLREASGRQE